MWKAERSGYGCNLNDVPSGVLSTQHHSLETITAYVRMQLERRCPNGAPPGIDLSDVAGEAAETFRSARIDWFVSVLAVREANDLLARTATIQA